MPRKTTRPQVRTRSGQRKRAPRNNGDPALDAALRLLARRSYPTATVRERIAARFGDEEATRVVERLSELRLLDDRDWAERFARDRFERAGYGRERIRAELTRRGLDAADIEAALAAVVSDELERARAQAVLARFCRLRAARKGRRVDDGGAKAREAAFRHLIGRGFPLDLVRDLLDGSR